MTHSLQLRWTKRALSRLADILKHIAADNPAAANKLAKAIRSNTEALCDTPYLGKEVTPGVRELIIHRHYLVTYRVMSDGIDILQVWHTAQKRSKS
jgi:addiction module RelE/StbE family toxin